MLEENGAAGEASEKTGFTFLCNFQCICACAADYPDGSNSSEYLVQPTTYLPENFTYAQNLPCPQRLPSMSTYVADFRERASASLKQL